MKSKISQCKTLIENQSKLAAQILDGEIEGIFEDDYKVFVHINTFNNQVSYNQYVKLTDNQMNWIHTVRMIDRRYRTTVEIIV